MRGTGRYFLFFLFFYILLILFILAADAGACVRSTGLDVINEIIAGSSRLLRGGSPVKELWMECSHNHPLTIKRALESSAGSRHVYKGIEAIDDFNGKNRFVRIVFM